MHMLIQTMKITDREIFLILYNFHGQRAILKYAKFQLVLTLECVIKFALFNTIFWDCAKTTHCLNAVFWLFNYDFNRLRNQKMYFLQQWRISFLIIFRKSWTKNWKYENAKFLACNRSTISKNFISVVCSMWKFLPDGEQKSSTHKQALNCIDGQQFTHWLVFNRTAKSRRTKYIANYFEKFVM